MNGSMSTNGERQGRDDMYKSDHLGVETDSPVVSINDLRDLGVILTPLLPPNSRAKKKSYLAMEHISHSNCVAKISPWIDFIKLKSEIKMAARLYLETCLLPPPPTDRSSFTNYARGTNRILRSQSSMQFWLRIPLTEAGHIAYAWKIWDDFRVLCDYNNKLSVCLDVPASLLSTDSIIRHWLQEPLKAVILQTKCFQPNALGPLRLSPHQERQITPLFESSIKIVISGSYQDNPHRASSCDADNDVNPGKKENPFWPYLNYIDSLHKMWLMSAKLDPVDIRAGDLLQLQNELSLDDMNMVHVKDLMKYSQYQKAICQALKDKVSDEEASVVTTVLMIAGRQCAPLVMVSLKAAVETNRKIKILAFEGYDDASSMLEMVLRKGSPKFVKIVSCNMRSWESSEKADIFISDYLGSFGDDETSPERIDDAQKFLKEDGISIPSSYKNFIQPVTASGIHSNIKSHKDLAHFETSYFVNLDRVAQIGSVKPVFEFSHPNRSAKISNERVKKLQFELPNCHIVPALVHGFVGYFEAMLYKEVSLSTVPGRATPNMLSWSPVFFPLVTPVYFQPGMVLEAHFWRCTMCNFSKVFWYEWCVASPCATPIHNWHGHASRGDYFLDKCHKKLE